MTRSECFVLDANVLVSALAFPSSTPRKAFDLAIVRGSILVSDETLLELCQTLRRPRLARYFGRAEQEVFLAMLASEATLVQVSERISVCRDPRDDRFLELAIAGEATHLITGDRDLLALDPFRDTRIMTPAAFLASAAQPQRARRRGRTCCA
jgi:putative PIN family toxin of toxin-antitoxin system